MPPSTCTTAVSRLTSSTLPSRDSPAGVMTSTDSSKLTSRTPEMNTSGSSTLSTPTYWTGLSSNVFITGSPAS